MIAVDTNILVYAHRGDSSFYKKAFEVVTALAESQIPWAIPWPCIHEFFGVVTHPKIYRPSTSIEAAVDQIDAWKGSPFLHLIGESDHYWDTLKGQILKTQYVGPKIHDLKIASICLAYGVDELWSADRDFSRVSGLKIINPLIQG